MLFRLKGRIAISLASVVLLVVSEGQGFAEGWVPDAWITARAKIALLTTRGLTARDVVVDSIAGRVSLSGKVPTAADKRKAEEIVRPIEGVESIRNLLRVVTSRRSQRKRASDATLNGQVAAALTKDPQLASSQIRVVSVTNGLVVLSGTARSSREHLRAIEIARRVRDIRNVESRVTTIPADASLDIWQSHELRQDGPGVLDAASDLWMTTQTRLKLLADARISALDVSVDSRDGWVTLFGAVPSQQARRAAGEDAASVAGAGRVRNDLEIVPASKQASVAAQDVEIERAVGEAIYKRPEMKRAAIKVEVHNGVVRLSGTVPSEQHRMFAATAARGVLGVRAVEQQISVTRITEDPAGKEKP